jgi:hypothetical protein
VACSHLRAWGKEKDDCWGSTEISFFQETQFLHADILTDYEENMNVVNKTLLLTLLCLGVQGCISIAPPDPIVYVVPPNMASPDSTVSVVPPNTAFTTTSDDKVAGQTSPVGNQDSTGTGTGSSISRTPQPGDTTESNKTRSPTTASEGKATRQTPPSENKSSADTGTWSSISRTPQPRIPQPGDTTENNKTRSPDSIGASSNEAVEPSPLAFQVKYYYRHKENTGFFEKLEPNSQLFSGDLYAIKLTLKEDGYMYVYQVGGDGKIQDLMANSKRNNKNKVAKDKTIILPADMEAFSLNDVTGQEEIYVLVFKQRYTMLENQYNAISNAAKTNSGDKTELEDGQREMLKILRETTKEKVSFRHDEKTNTKETQP